jgi:fermentation-respiration switch protein FrsA (DUF1100 family)
MPQEVSFRVEGTEVRADLYLPPDLKPGERRPAIVAGHGFSAVKEALLAQGNYFSAAGYIVLTIDYRGFGLSGGDVRGELFPERQVEDFRSGISYLQTRDDVEHDRIALWGTSFAGGIVLAAAARDQRARAVVSQTPIVDGRRWMQFLRGASQWGALVDALAEDRARRFAGEPSRRIPSSLYHTTEEISGMLGDQQQIDFLAPMADNMKSWRADMTLESMEKIIEFHPIKTIDLISPRPLCIIMNSGYEAIHPLDQVMEAYAAAHEPKTLVMLPYDQLGLYVDPGQTAALAAALDFFQRELPVGSARGGSIPRTSFV